MLSKSTCCALVVGVVLVMILAGCGAPAPDEAEMQQRIEAAVEATIAAMPTPEPEVIEVEVTRIVEVTPAPEPVNEEADIEIEDTGDVPGVVWRGSAIQDRGGVIIEVTESGLIDFNAAEQAEQGVAQLRDFSAFEDATILGVMTVTVTNTTESKINVYPTQGTVVVGREQIDLGRFLFFSDSVGGSEVFPGVVSSGDIVFALERTLWGDIAEGTTLIYEVSPPSDSDTFERLATDPYRFEFELSPVTEEEDS